MDCMGCIDLVARGRGAKVFMVCVIMYARMVCIFPRCIYSMTAWEGARAHRSAQHIEHCAYWPTTGKSKILL
jgi:hypothetical protein